MVLVLALAAVVAPGVDVDTGAVGDPAHAGVHGAGGKGVGCQVGFGGVGAGDRALRR